MDPNGAHDDVGLGNGAVRDGLGDGPDMVGEDGGAIGNIGGKEKRDRVYEDGCDGGGDEKSRDDVSGGVATVARKGAAERMRRGENWCFGGSSRVVCESASE